MMILIAAAAFLAAPIPGLNANSHLGDTTRANFAAMIVPPLPRGPGMEGGAADLGVAAVRRLQTDKVKPLVNTAISPQLVWKP